MVVRGGSWGLLSTSHKSCSSCIFWFMRPATSYRDSTPKKNELVGVGSPMINALVRQQWALDQCTSQAAWSPWLNKARRAFNGKHVAFWLLQDAWERSVTTLISRRSATMASRFPSRGALLYPFMLSCWYVAWNALISVTSDDQISAPLPVAQLAVAGSCRDTFFQLLVLWADF